MEAASALGAHGLLGKTDIRQRSRECGGAESRGIECDGSMGGPREEMEFAASPDK